jgi:hypothetical protein
MGAHMKTTIEIADELLDRSKAVARREHTTLRSLVEDGLRRVLDEQSAKKRPFQLRAIQFCGGGFKEGFDAASWQRIRDAVYEGRGT